MQAIEPSATLQITAEAGRLRREGKNVISLAAGEPDFPTPRNIKDEAIKAIEEDFTHYTPASGIPELKEAIAEKFKKDWGIEYKPSEVIVSVGAKQVIFNAIYALCDQGDEIIVIAPAWVSYVEQIKLAGGKPVIVNASEEDDFVPNPEEIERKISNRTKAIIINTPNNPTGAVYPKDVLLSIAKMAISRDIFIISDEIYEKLSYGEKSESLAHLFPEAKEKMLIVNGVSKAYAMTGWRIGWGLGPQDLIRAMGIVQGHMTSNPCSIAQRAALEAVRGPQDEVKEMVKEFEKRRELLFSSLRGAPYIRLRKPKGAFYLFVNIKETIGKKLKGEAINDDADFCKKLLSEKLVAVVPGKAFLSPGYIRISYAASRKELEEASCRIKEFLESLD
ncbi:MAG: pyridoxal phosphate-dependent aminotransferase [Synergistetes bacterium]|nr:pyridoxal phosphate-dependent aminotransferase [Synergistota bacterium]